MSSERRTTLTAAKEANSHADTSPQGAIRQSSEDYFQSIDEYDGYDDFEIGSGSGGGSSKSVKRLDNRGHSGSQGIYSAKHTRLRAERPKSTQAKGK